MWTELYNWSYHYSIVGGDNTASDKKSNRTVTTTAVSV